MFCALSTVITFHWIYLYFAGLLHETMSNNMVAEVLLAKAIKLDEEMGHSNELGEDQSSDDGQQCSEQASVRGRYRSGNISIVIVCV